MKLIHVTDTSGRKVAIVAGNIGVVMPTPGKIDGKDVTMTAIMTGEYAGRTVWDVKESYADIIAQLEGDETAALRKQIAELTGKLANTHYEQSMVDIAVILGNAGFGGDGALDGVLKMLAALSHAKCDAEEDKARLSRKCAHTHEVTVMADTMADLLLKTINSGVLIHCGASSAIAAEIEAALAKHAEGKK